MFCITKTHIKKKNSQSSIYYIEGKQDNKLPFILFFEKEIDSRIDAARVMLLLNNFYSCYKFETHELTPELIALLNKLKKDFQLNSLSYHFGLALNLQIGEQHYVLISVENHAKFSINGQDYTTDSLIPIQLEEVITPISHEMPLQFPEYPHDKLAIATTITGGITSVLGGISWGLITAAAHLSIAPIIGSLIPFLTIAWPFLLLAGGITLTLAGLYYLESRHGFFSKGICCEFLGKNTIHHPPSFSIY